MKVKSEISSLDKVLNDIVDWAEVRGLIYGQDIQPEKQMLKLVEEVGETARALAYDDAPGLKDGIGDRTRSYFERTAPKAAMAMVGALYDPTELGIRDKMSAAKDLLDRAGLGKVDKIDVGSSTGGVFILPSKEGTNE